MVSETIRKYGEILAAAYAGTLASEAPAGVTDVAQVLPNPETWRCTYGGERVCAVVGVQSPNDYLPIAAGWTFPIAAFGGVVNRRFWTESTAAMGVLAGPRPTVYIGHSRGGAVAIITARRMKDAFPAEPTPAVFTFGAPRSVSQAAALTLGWPSITNIADAADPVPMVPPTGTLGLNWVHPGDYWALTPGTITLDQQGDSSAIGIIRAINAGGIARHFQLAYNALMGAAPVVPAVFIQAGGSGMNIWKITVKGRMLGQAAVNVLHYAAVNDQAEPATVPPETVLEMFRARWRSLVVARVSNTYSVVEYDVRRVTGVIVNPEVGEDHLFRYSDVHSENGAAQDVGADAGAVFPTFCAVGLVKYGSRWLRGDNGNAINNMKQPKGSMRIAGILESATPTADHLLTDAAKSIWSGAGQGLRRIWVGGAINFPALQMCLITTLGNGEQLVSGDPPVPYFAAALVDRIILNPFMTSQNSRKVGRTVIGH